MTGVLTVYISPPATERGLWRVQCDGRPVDEFQREEEAIRRAAECVRMAENAGGRGIIKVERPDGSWAASEA